MFENVGKKIKRFAKNYFYGECICVIIAVVLLFICGAVVGAHGEIFFIAAISLLFLFPLIWLIYLLLAGYGELIEHAASIDNKLDRAIHLAARPVEAPTPVAASCTPREAPKPAQPQAANNLQELQKMRDAGTMSEEEYQLCLHYME